jgi:hypothetical protein
MPEEEFSPELEEQPDIKTRLPRRMRGKKRIFRME